MMNQGNLFSFLVNNLDILWIYGPYGSMQLNGEAVQWEEFYFWLTCIKIRCVFKEESMVFVSLIILIECLIILIE